MNHSSLILQKNTTGVFLLVIMWIFFLIGNVYAQSYKLTNFVTDTAGVLSTEQLTQLNSGAQNIQDATSNEIATLLIPNRNGKELYDIALEVFRDNGIGDKDKDNGVLLTISTEEKKLRITVGYGLEGALPDVLASQIIEKELRPLLNSGLIFETVQQYQTLVAKAIEGEYKADPVLEETLEQGNQFFVGFMIGFMFLSWIARPFVKSKLKSGKLGKSLGKWIVVIVVGLLLTGLLGIILGFIGIIIGTSFGALFNGNSSGRSGGFGSGGFGGGSFGGGGFGGGGFGGFGGGSSGGGGAGD